MGREARVEIPGYFYHIIVRGQRKNPIFFSHEDYIFYLKILSINLRKLNYNINAFCLMKNHIHILTKHEEFAFEKLMKPLQTTYAIYFNRKYQLSGHVFQGRYKSFIILNYRYLKSVIEYIHNNPVKAGFVDSPEKYLYSSIHYYRGISDVLDFQYIDPIGIDKIDSSISFDNLQNLPNQYIGTIDEYKELEKRKTGRDGRLYQERRLVQIDLKRICHRLGIDINEIQDLKWSKYKNSIIIDIVNELYGLGYSQRDIARAINYSKSSVSRWLSRKWDKFNHRP